MEPDADPEARIRDLERPLAERACASELGTQPYQPMPPPGPSPYFAPPQHVVRKRSPAAAWILPLAIGVVAVTAAIGAVVYFTSTSISVPSSEVAGGGGPIDGPAVPELPALPGFPSQDEIVSVGPGESTSIAGVQTRRTVRCDGGTVSVSGVENVVEVTGACGSITVSGMTNVVKVETARLVAASGFDNRVTYRDGTPEVITSGSGNVVEQG
ncbi:DUF3060 domain-containing protein [Mycobacterium sp. pV006]|uniref:DUF3060 domain-containing protein n=1 Tax=Mycobacterium sp. pV006 TaxID=3238983 RepID=UPI00351B17C5